MEWPFLRAVSSIFTKYYVLSHSKMPWHTGLRTWGSPPSWTARTGQENFGARDSAFTVTTPWTVASTIIPRSCHLGEVHWSLWAAILRRLAVRIAHWWCGWEWGEHISTLLKFLRNNNLNNFLHKIIWVYLQLSGYFLAKHTQMQKSVPFPWYVF